MSTNLYDGLPLWPGLNHSLSSHGWELFDSCGLMPDNVSSISLSDGNCFQADQLEVGNTFLNSCIAGFHTLNCRDFNTLRHLACDCCSPVSTTVENLWELGICHEAVPLVYTVVVYILYTAILVAALVGNILVVYVVGGTAKMRTVTNYFIVNLAVGDLFTAVFCIPFTFMNNIILGYWPFGKEMCIVVNYLQGVTVFVSAYSLVAISIDRYLAIIYPLRPRMTRLQARVIIWLVWALALTTTAPLAYFSTLFKPDKNPYQLYHREVCMEKWGDNSLEEQATYSAVLMFLQYFLPVTVLVFTYTRIGFVVWGKRSLGETPARHDRIARGKRKMIKMMVVVVAVYTLCWLPFNVLMVVRDVNRSLDDWPGMRYLWTAFHWLAMSHACYNPVILCWMNNKFRSGFCYVGYHVPCMRRCLDSCYASRRREEDLQRAATFNLTQGSRLSSRLIVSISMKDDSIIFKSRHCNGSTSHDCPGGRHVPSSEGADKFLNVTDDTSSESRL